MVALSAACRDVPLGHKKSITLQPGTHCSLTTALRRLSLVRNTLLHTIDDVYDTPGQGFTFGYFSSLQQ